MSSVASNSIPGHKSKSILIFILIFFDAFLQISAMPTEFPAVYETIEKEIEPETSWFSYSTWGLGDAISYGVELVQKGIKYVMGVEDHPREFYIVHIKDEKNPENDKDVLRERGREGKDSDIPLEGGKLPANSIIVSSQDPHTESVSSSQKPDASETNDSTNTTPDRIVPVTENEPQQSHSVPSSKGTSDIEQGNNDFPANIPRKNDNNTNPTPPSLPSNPNSSLNKKIISNGSQFDKTGAFGGNSENVKLPNVHSDHTTIHNLTDDRDQSETDQAQNPPQNQLQSNHEVNSSEGENLLKLTQNQHSLLNSDSHIPHSVTPPESKVDLSKKPNIPNKDNSLEQQGNEVLQNLVDFESAESSLPIEDMNLNHRDHVPNHIQDRHEIDTFGEENNSSEVPSAGQHSLTIEEPNLHQNLASSSPPKIEENCPAVEDTVNLHESDLPTLPSAHESESLPSDAVDFNKCETEFIKVYCEDNPKFCEEASHKEYVDHIKNNSGCELKKESSNARYPSIGNDLALQQNSKPASSSQIAANHATDADAVGSHDSGPHALSDTHEPESLTLDDGSFNECEAKYIETYCEIDPEFCQEASEKEFINHVKNNSGCKLIKEEPEIAEHSQVAEDVSSHQHLEPSSSSEIEENNPINADAVNLHNSNPAILPGTHEPESFSSDAGNFNECETNYIETYCESDPKFCQEASDNVFMDHVKKNSGCEIKKGPEITDHSQIAEEVALHKNLEPSSSPKIEENYSTDTGPVDPHNSDSSTPPESHELESHPLDASSFNECETNYIETYCESDPKFCQEASDNVFMDHVKKNSGCEIKKGPEIPDHSRIAEEVAPHQNLEPSSSPKIEENYSTDTGPVDPHDSDSTTPPESHELESHPLDVSSFNECETNYIETYCESDPKFCQEASDEEYIDHVKKNSGCELKEESEITQHSSTADESHLQNLEPSSSLESDENRPLSVDVDSHDSDSPTLPADTHESEPPPLDTSNFNECETKYIETYCETDPKFCEEASDEEYLDHVKKNSGCEAAPSSDHDQSSNSNDSISVEQCETKYVEILCGKKPEFCTKFKSNEDFYDYVKKNSGCNPTLPLKPTNECETEYEREFCEQNFEFCEELKSTGDFIDFIKQNSGCNSEELHEDDANEDHSSLYQPQHDSQPNENVHNQGLNGIDDDELSSDSNSKPIKPPKKKNSGLKKNPKKTKGSKNKS